MWRKANRKSQRYLPCKRGPTFYQVYQVPLTAGQVVNSVDPDEMLHYVAYDLGLHC